MRENSNRVISNKRKFAVYFTEEERAEIDRWYKATNCGSRTEFVEQAVNFFIGYLKTGETNFYLPPAVEAVIEGRLGTFEDRMSRLLFKQAVELDMVIRISAAQYEWSDEDVERLRASCAQEVQRTKGQLSFKEIARQGRRHDGG